MTTPQTIAWLESAEGRQLALDGASSLGKSRSLNRHALDHETISRRHALILAQEGGEFWLVDLGSTNGTFVNDARVTMPRRLIDGDQIHFGALTEGLTLAFRQPVSAEQLRTHSALQRTAVFEAEDTRWMLITDLAGFTLLSKQMPATELARVVGEWLAAAAEVVQLHGGRVNKYTGDGFLAYWHDRPDSAQHVASALLGFEVLRARSTLAFRVALHHGRVATSGSLALGEENLYSDDLSLVFRLETLAGSLGTPVLISAAAAERLGGAIELLEIPGAHAVKNYSPLEQLRTLSATIELA